MLPERRIWRRARARGLVFRLGPAASPEAYRRRGVLSLMLRRPACGTLGGLESLVRLELETIGRPFHCRPEKCMMWVW